jgi:hypothetical protein
MKTLKRFAIFCGLALCAYVQAQNPSRLSALPEGNFQFTGNWDCGGSFRAGQIHKSTFTGAVILDGKWLELTEQDVQPATGYVAEYLIGYDAQHKQLVEFDANNFSAAAYASDQGWSKGVLTMTSPVSQDAGAPYVANRFQYSITGPDAFTVDWQISKTAALNWLPGDHLACTRRTHS